MRTVQIRDAKAHLSELVELAGSGEPVTITKHGAPMVMIVPLNEGRKLYPEKPKSTKTLIQVLREYPGGLDLDELRDRTPMRDIDL